MAQVKISELPNISDFSMDNILVINDTSNNTTCKTNLRFFYQTSTHNMTAPDGITMTENGATITSVPYYVMTCLGRIMTVKIPDAHIITFTNTTSSPIALNMRLNTDVHLGAIGNLSDGINMCLVNTVMVLMGNTTSALIVPANSSITTRIMRTVFTGIADVPYTHSS